MSANQGQPAPERSKRRCVEGVLTQGQECQKRAGEFRSSGQRELADAQLERAIIHYSEAIRIDPNHSQAYLLRARAFEEKGDDDKAEADLVKAREINPDEA